MEAMNVYQFTYSDADFDEAFTSLQIAPTPGKAKSAEFRAFSDYDPDVKYMDFLKLVKVRKIGQSTPRKNESPYPNQARIELINGLIRVIGRAGRRFLYSNRHDRFAAFHWADGKLWLVDDYTDRPLLMDKEVRGQHRHFSHGGTMWGLVCDFRDYILGDDDANHNNGYGGLYSPHWGYPEEDMEFIREYAKSIGYLKPRSWEITKEDIEEMEYQVVMEGSERNLDDYLDVIDHIQTNVHFEVDEQDMENWLTKMKIGEKVFMRDDCVIERIR